MKKNLIILSSLLLSLFYLSQAINLDLSSGDTLSSTSWQEISSITDKMNLSGNNLNISGKLVSSSKICAGSKCLGECNSGETWVNATATCTSDTQTSACSGSILTNGVSNGDTNFIQTWDSSSETYLPADLSYYYSTTSGECTFICDTSSSNNYERYYWDGDSCELLAGPTDFQLDSKTDTTLTFSWTDDPVAPKHWLRNQTDTTERVIQDSSAYTFTGLTPGKQYTIFLVSGENEYNGTFVRSVVQTLIVRTECSDGYTYDSDSDSCVIPATTPETAALDCKDLYENYNARDDGVYYIKPESYTGEAFEVYCDMTYDGGGWTLMSAYKTTAGVVIGPSKVSNGTLNYDPYVAGVNGTNRFIDASTIDANNIRYDCKSNGKNRIVQIGSGSLATSIKNNPLATRSSSFTPGVYGENHTGATPTAAGGYGNNNGFMRPFGNYSPDRGIRFDGGKDSCATGGEGRGPYNLGGVWTIRIK